MAQPLRPLRIYGLSDAESVATRDGPYRLILEHAESISRSRAILFVLRAKGILRSQPGGAFLNDNAEEEEGSDDSSVNSDKGDDGWCGWIAERKDKEDPDLGLVLVSALDVDDFGSDHAGGGANAAHHHHFVADGWAVDNLDPFSRAIDLGIMLEEVTADIVPRLVKNPADLAALRRLRSHGRRIRRVGKELPWLMGQHPVSLGNFLQNVGGKALRRGTGWIASRFDNILARVLAVYEDHPLNFNLE